MGKDTLLAKLTLEQLFDLYRRLDTHSKIRDSTLACEGRIKLIARILQTMDKLTAEQLADICCAIYFDMCST